jgi:hypothetical protein
LKSSIFGCTMKFCFLFFFILHVDYSFLVLPPLSTSISNEDVEYILLHISTSYVCHFNAMIFSTRVVATCNYGTILLPTPWHIHHHLNLMCRSILLTLLPYLPPTLCKREKYALLKLLQVQLNYNKEKRELRKCQSPAHIV